MYVDPILLEALTGVGTITTLNQCINNKCTLYTFLVYSMYMWYLLNQTKLLPPLQNSSYATDKFLLINLPFCLLNIYSKQYMFIVLRNFAKFISVK